MNDALWQTANQHALVAELDRVRLIVQGYLAPNEATIIDQVDRAFTPSDRSSALDGLCETFSLSPFERDVLLLCAGHELDARYAALFAADDVHQPTFALALAALPDAHWSALAPHATLRYWRLIIVGDGPTLTHSPLRIDERILHQLTGLPECDERLTGWIEPMDALDQLLPAQQATSDRIAAIWTRAQSAAATPIVQLGDGEPSVLRAIAIAACRALDLKAFRLLAHTLPAGVTEVESLARLWSREAALSRSALIVDATQIDRADTEHESRLRQVIDQTRSPVIILGTLRPWRTARPTVTLEVGAPTADEQRALWQIALGPTASRLNGQLDRLVTQFQLTSAQVQAAVVEAQDRSHIPDDLGPALWSASRRQARPRLDDLAQRLQALATWDDLVLPDRQKATLREIAAQVRQRAKVYGEWGFHARSVNGLGITALFAGDSGTGKTMAAEVLANELQLDLYRIDLSQVVSKYIGETEKNLRRVFDTAETGGAILLFDEADALFGKRSEVKDSHDRYANIEVSYLLQRMEVYRGLAVLTTNLRHALDTAFMRRLRFVVQFPFPDARQRADIWRRIFPIQTPTDALDADRLARLNVPGGSIRNIALHAAFLAADLNEPVRMTHLLQAARSEYAKLDKPLTDSEVKDWLVMSDE